MIFFAHIGITLGSAWVLQKTIGRIKHRISRSRLNYIATGDVSDHTTEIDTKPRSTANWIDYRFLLLGSILPDIFDKTLGVIYLGNGRSFCHSLFFTVLILVAGILLYRIRKSPWLLCIALGCVAHLLLDTMWLNPRFFYWPLFGWDMQNSNISFGVWAESIFSSVLRKPSEYVPEIICAASLGFLFIDYWRGGVITRRIKYRLNICYENLYKWSKRKLAFIEPMLSKKTEANYNKASVVVVKVAD